MVKLRNEAATTSRNLSDLEWPILIIRSIEKSFEVLIVQADGVISLGGAFGVTAATAKNASETRRSVFR